MSTVKSESEIARHEAGHVVAYHWFRKEFQSVSILSEEDWKGRCSPKLQDRQTWDGSKPMLTEWMIVACAGVAAEMLWRSTDQPISDWLNQEDVQFVLKKYTSCFEEASSASWTATCYQKAEKIMKQQRASVERVADALLDHKIMDGAALVAFIR